MAVVDLDVASILAATGWSGASDAVYSSSALSRSDALAALNAWRLRATITESGGMADSATVEIDRMWVEIDYEVAGAGTDLVRVLEEAVGAAEVEKRLRALARVNAEGLDLGASLGRAMARVRRQGEALDILEGRQAARGRQRVVGDALGLTEAAIRQLGMSQVIDEAVAATEAVARLLRLARMRSAAVGLAEATIRSRTLARVRDEAEAIAAAVVRIGAVVSAVPAIVMNRLRMRTGAARPPIVGAASRMNVPPARR